MELFANNGDPAQIPRSVASDLGLHCLLISLLEISSLQWVTSANRSRGPGQKHRAPTGAGVQDKIIASNFPASILYKSIAGRYRPVSYPDGPITARYRFIKNAYWVAL